MNQEVISYLWLNNHNNLKILVGRIAFILPFFIFSNAFAQQKADGIILSDFEFQKIVKRYFSVRGNIKQLPKSYSLKQYAPKPLNQLDYATSPGWATSYAALTIIDAQQTGRKGKDITKNAFSPLFPYYYSFTKPELQSCNQQVSIGQVLASLKKHGAPKYTKFPVRCVTHSPKNLLAAASKNRISEYARLYDIGESEAKKISAIKTSLADNLPVVIGMHITKSFDYAKEFWSPRESFSKDLPAKAFCIVGYDDLKYGGSFEIMNSQGTAWGNDGFLWIPYTELIKFTRQAFSLYMIPSKNSNSQLSGGVELEIVNGGGSMDLIQLNKGYYKIRNSYPSGTQFKIKIINHSTGFLYVFASDLTKEIFGLFPPALTSAAFSTESSLYVPDENTPIEIDETIGTDYLCVIFSKEDLDFTGIQNEIKSKTGSFQENVHATLADKLVPASQVNYNLTKADFLVTKTDKSIVVLIIEHTHN